MTANTRKPIQYTDLVDIRFADLDFYGHVNSKHYVDLVSTARLNFLEREMQTSVAQVAKNGFGFFLMKSTINYKRPISGLQRVLVNSHVEQIRDETVLIIPFSISSADGSKLYSDGTLEFGLVDMSTHRKTVANEWVLDLFFEKLG